MKTIDKLFIGGSYVDPAGTDTIEIVNASTEDVVARTPEGSIGDIDRAVAAAREAFDNGPWPRMPATERAAVITAISQAIQVRMQEFAETISTENGSPISWSLAGQVFAATMVFDFYAGLAESYPWEERRQGVLGPALVRREPVGVVGAIIPWNVPLFVAALKLGPALLSGSTVVLKPSPETALDAYLLAEVVEATGLPPGVLNIVPAGREVGEHLVVHPDIDKISFTGSTAAGRRIGALCGERLRRCTLELGGKSAAIVLEDADLGSTLDLMVPAGLMNNGQACVAQTRILAPRRRYDEIVDAIAERVAAMKVGDALDPETQVGPLVAKRQQDRVLGYIEKGQAEGAKVLVGGGKPASQPKGWFVELTVFVEVDNKMTIAQEEIFGPVLSVIRYDGIDEAIAIANESSYGLSGGVYGSDVDSATDVARRVRTGTLQVNSMSPMDFAAPFGGFKHSGVGRELGPEGLEAYVEYKTITLPAS